MPYETDYDLVHKPTRDGVKIIKNIIVDLNIDCSDNIPDLFLITEELCNRITSKERRSKRINTTSGVRQGVVMALSILKSPITSCRGCQNDKSHNRYGTNCRYSYKKECMLNGYNYYKAKEQKILKEA